MAERAGTLLAAFAVALVGVFAGTSAAQAGVHFEGAWDTGSWDALAADHSLGTGPNGSVYALEGFPAAVSRYGPSGERKKRWSVQDPFPSAIDVDEDGLVSVLGTGHIERFGPNGKKLEVLRFPPSFRGKSASYVSSFVATSGGGYLLVDGDHNRILRLNAKGRFIGLFGSGEAEFSYVTDIAVAPSGHIYVAEPGVPRILKFDSAGKLVDTWDGEGAGAREFVSPATLGVSPEGTVFVGDETLLRVQAFDESGEFLAQWGSSGTGNGRFTGFSGIAAVAGGLVYVGNLGGERIQKFRIDDGPADPQAQLFFGMTHWHHPGLPGTRVPVEVGIFNFGTAPARGLRICPGRRKDMMKVMKGVKCRQIGVLMPRKVRRATIMVNAPRGWRGEHYIAFRLKSKNAGGGSMDGSITVKPRRR